MFIKLLYTCFILLFVCNVTLASDLLLKCSANLKNNYSYVVQIGDAFQAGIVIKDKNSLPVVSCSLDLEYPFLFEDVRVPIIKLRMRPGSCDNHGNKELKDLELKDRVLLSIKYFKDSKRRRMLTPLFKRQKSSECIISNIEVEKLTIKIKKYQKENPR